MIHLVPLTHDDAVTLDRACNDPASAGTYAWFGHQAPVRTARVDAGTALRDDAGLLGVRDDKQRLVGCVSWHQRDNGPPPHGRCWMIGIMLLPEHRGHGYGRAAQRALVEYLFAHTPFVRIEAGTEAANTAERRALEATGFTQEGVLRQACFRDGQWRDIVVYGILRHEVEL